MVPACPLYRGSTVNIWAQSRVYLMTQSRYLHLCSSDRGRHYTTQSFWEDSWITRYHTRLLTSTGYAVHCMHVFIHEHQYMGSIDMLCTCTYRYTHSYIHVNTQKNSTYIQYKDIHVCIFVYINTWETIDIHLVMWYSGCLHIVLQGISGFLVWWSLESAMWTFDHDLIRYSVLAPCTYKVQPL